MSLLSQPLCPTMVATGPCMGGKHCRLLLLTMPLQPCPYSLPLCPTVIVTDHSMGKRPFSSCLLQCLSGHVLVSLPLCPSNFVTGHFMGNKGHLALACYNAYHAASLLSRQRRSTIVVTGLDGLSAGVHSTPYTAWCLAHQQQPVLADDCKVHGPQPMAGPAYHLLVDGRRGLLAMRPCYHGRLGRNYTSFKYLFTTAYLFRPPSLCNCASMCLFLRQMMQKECCLHCL